MNNKIGIALSGGGARGMAHIGVLKALEENGICPSHISGSSAGSIVGAMYAAGKTPDEMLELAEETSLFKIFKLGLPTMGLTDLSYLEEILSEHIPIGRFEALDKPLFVCVTSLNRGKWKIIQSGKLFEAVMASCSIPLIFKPVEINGEVFVDGGLLNNLPVEPLRVDCDLVIGVNVMPLRPQEEIGHIISVGERCADLIVWSNSEQRLKQCDVAIDVESAGEFGIFDFGKAHEIFTAAYEETQQKIPSILEKLGAI